MKIGILTFYNALNYGAVLQAYALQTKIKKMKYECEIINYECPAFVKNYKTFSVKSRSLKGIASATLNLPMKYKKNCIFEEFRKEYLNVSKEKNNFDKVSLNNLKYDKIVVGSDQVWNTTITNKDKTYFLPNVKCDRISYAASMGKKELEDDFCKLIDKFNSISVREEESCIYLKNQLKKEVSWVLDPVFLIDKEEWIKFIESEKLVNKRYIFAYCLHEEEVYKIAEKMKSRENIDIIYVPNRLGVNVNGKRKNVIKVKEFLKYIYYADCVITDSFHVVAFSIIFNKNFRAILKSSYKGLNGRILSILQKLKLDDFAVNTMNVSEEIYNLKNKPDFNISNKILNKEKKLSNKFLKNALEGEKNEN